MSNLPWKPPPPGGPATRSPPKVVFEGIPAGSTLATELYRQLRGPINKFYTKAAAAHAAGVSAFSGNHQHTSEMSLRYANNHGQETITVKVTKEFAEAFEQRQERKPWDWVLLEIHVPGDELLIPARMRALRIVPAPGETGVQYDGYVYDYDSMGRFEDGLTPSVLQYPPHPSAVTPQLTLSEGKQVAALLVDLRRFNSSSGAALIAEISGFVDGAPGDTYPLLTGYNHDVVQFIFPSTFIYRETLNTNTRVAGSAQWVWTSEPPSEAEKNNNWSAYGQWVVSPASIWNGGINKDQETFFDTGQSDYTHSVAAANAPLAEEAFIDVVEMSSGWTANGSPNPNVGLGSGNAQFAGVYGGELLFDAASGLVKQITTQQVRSYWATSKPTSGGLVNGHTWTYDVQLGDRDTFWYPNPTYQPTTPTEPKEVVCVARIAGGFGAPPLEPIKISDAGVPTGEYSRVAVLDAENENATIIGTFIANDHVVLVGPQADADVWPFIGRLIINPGLQAASFSTDP